MCKNLFSKLFLEDPSIDEFVDHSRQIQCPPAQFEHLVTQGRDGEMIIGQSANGLIEKGFMECYYRALNGSLYPEISKYQFDGEWKRVSVSTSFLDLVYLAH